MAPSEVEVPTPPPAPQLKSPATFGIHGQGQVQAPPCPGDSYVGTPNSDTDTCIMGCGRFGRD
eukprot:11403873-Prorocentrum_lima.AAC.1